MKISVGHLTLLDCYEITLMKIGGSLSRPMLNCSSCGYRRDIHLNWYGSSCCPMGIFPLSHMFCLSPACHQSSLTSPLSLIRYTINLQEPGNILASRRCTGAQAEKNLFLIRKNCRYFGPICLQNVLTFRCDRHSCDNRIGGTCPLRSPWRFHFRETLYPLHPDPVLECKRNARSRPVGNGDGNGEWQWRLATTTGNGK